MSALQSLNGDSFVQLIRAGHARLKENVQTVNALNVFPVPDGDTGTNMELSLASGVHSLAAHPDWQLAGATQALAAGLLMGARGNSGVILSQLFRGFLKVGREELDCLTFAAALQEGVQIAYRAVAKPVEGTILTVAREAAMVGVKEAKHAIDLADWMEAVVQAAQRALQRTPEQLPVLKQAGVVDSGGQGLLYIYDGFLQWLRGGVPLSLTVQDAPVFPTTSDFAAAHIVHEGEHGYCTEALIRVEGVAAEAAESRLRAQLGQYGDSLLVVAADDLVKIHVHTLNPGRALEDALQFGALISVKVDNMTEQHAALRAHAPAPNKPLAVVAVASGEGLRDIFASLGADLVLQGGQTMNPSTEEIVEAVRASQGDQTIVLPNNKNIIMAAEQARVVLGEHIHVVPSATIPQGIAALMAYLPGVAVELNVERMTEAVRQVNSGQVVRAVRDSVYQERPIRGGQFLGLADQDLVEVGDDRSTVANAVIAAMGGADAELLTVFYGEEVDPSEVDVWTQALARKFDLEVEVRFGGQPVYDYIFTLE